MNTVQRAIAAIATYVQVHALAPDTARMTVPTVVVAGQTQFLSVAYYMGQPFSAARGEPRKVAFPFLEVHAQIPNLAITSRRIYPTEYGVSAGEGDFIGDLRDLQKISGADYRNARRKYYELLSVVIDHSLIVRTERPEISDRETAREIAHCLRIIEEKALHAYYVIADSQLKSWIETQTTNQSR